MLQPVLILLLTATGKQPRKKACCICSCSAFFRSSDNSVLWKGMFYVLRTDVQCRVQCRVQFRVQRRQASYLWCTSCCLEHRANLANNLSGNIEILSTPPLLSCHIASFSAGTTYVSVGWIQLRTDACNTNTECLMSSIVVATHSSTTKNTHSHSWSHESHTASVFSPAMLTSTACLEQATETSLLQLEVVRLLSPPIQHIQAHMQHFSVSSQYSFLCAVPASCFKVASAEANGAAKAGLKLHTTQHIMIKPHSRSQQALHHTGTSCQAISSSGSG